jgi:hypothetical protein
MLLSAYAPKKDPMHNSTSSLLTRARKEKRSLVLSIWARFPRKLVPRSIETYARSMGTCISCTIPRIVVGMRKTEQKNPFSVPPKKAERNRSTILHSEERRWIGSRRQSQNKIPTRRNNCHRDSDSNSE